MSCAALADEHPVGARGPGESALPATADPQVRELVERGLVLHAAGYDRGTVYDEVALLNARSEGLPLSSWADPLKLALDEAGCPTAHPPRRPRLPRVLELWSKPGQVSGTRPPSTRTTPLRPLPAEVVLRLIAALDRQPVLGRAMLRVLGRAAGRGGEGA